MGVFLLSFENSLKFTLSMLCYICNVTYMARGESGRIVIEVDSDLKRQLYIALSARNSTLKDWFVENAELFIEEYNQPRLSFEDHPSNVPPAPID